MMCSLFTSILIKFKAWHTKFANSLRINEKNKKEIENEPWQKERISITHTELPKEPRDKRNKNQDIPFTTVTKHEIWLHIDEDCLHFLKTFQC